VQIGFLSYPSGEFRTITNDTNDYDSFTLAADGKMLATVQGQSTGEINILNNGAGGGAPFTVPNIAKKAIIGGVSWDGDGQLLVPQGNRLARLTTDGIHAETLVNDSSAAIYSAIACADRRYIVFAWDGRGGGNGTNIWRVGADGSNPVQLTKGRTIEALCVRRMGNGYTS
jgi:Tol biopolymer transport system component